MKIFAPDGSVVTQRKTVNLPPEYMKMLAVFAETSERINLGLHCSGCKQDVTGANATADNGWRMDCECTSYVGKNPIQGH